ncbi:MAG: hypothetical protein P9M03_08455 [Candidatus Theseobacter exili]|nr:hypothetical protein [Candidatus Theseobacter exili]
MFALLCCFSGFTIIGAVYAENDNRIETIDGDIKQYQSIVRAGSEGVTLQMNDGIEFVAWESLPKSEVERLFPEQLDDYQQSIENKNKEKAVAEVQRVFPGKHKINKTNEVLQPAIVMGVVIVFGFLLLLLVVILLSKVFGKRRSSKEQHQLLAVEPVVEENASIALTIDFPSKLSKPEIKREFVSIQEGQPVNPMEVPENIPEPVKSKDVPKQASKLENAIEYPEDIPEHVVNKEKTQNNEQQQPTRKCANCGVEMEGSVLTCPSCGKLVYEFKDQDPA